MDNQEEKELQMEETQETEEQVEAPETQEVAQQEDVSTKNWRQMRELKEKAERERDEAIAILQRVASSNDKKPEVKAESDEDLDLSDEDFVEAKHLKKYYKKIKDELEQYKQQTVNATVESQLKAQYPDFDKVVSQENIKLLRDLYPELAETVNSNPNLYSKAVSAYTLIKQFGISNNQYDADKEKVKQNMAKPRTANSITPQATNSALDNANAFANGLTPELKAQLWKEMQDSIKRR